MRDIENIRRLAAALEENVAKCASDPGVDPVHDTRTGTRRLQASLESLVRELPPDEAGMAARDAAKATTQVLKKIRRAAGPVRDLDVHRKLLSKLTKRALGGEGAAKHAEGEVAGAGALETPQAGRRATPLDKQADDLDAWLKQRRGQSARDLQAHANGAKARLEKRLGGLEAALRARGLRRARKKAPAVVALESFARLATEMQALDAGNLHDFRKGAKKARYVAELAASGDEEAERVGGALKRLQDEIGDWHDWLVLVEEAHAALGDGAPELTQLIEAERERHFVAAMKAAAKLRGRLMGEWLAVGQRQPKREREGGQPGTGRRKAGQRKSDRTEGGSTRAGQRRPVKSAR